MNVTCVVSVVMVVVFVVSEVVCETDNSTETATAELPRTSISTPGLYGGSYYNDDAENPDNIHYIHGTFQAVGRDYYKSQEYFREDDGEETFDYYLGFGLSKMTDQNFNYSDFHYYYHDINRTITDNETIASDVAIACHPNATKLCPENTETICLLNGTIYCMSKITAVVPCSLQDNNTTNCVNTTVPCVRECIVNWNHLESILLPCLANIVIVDVYEMNDGKTLSRVGDSFILVDALTKLERTYCVTVIVDPVL